MGRASARAASKLVREVVEGLTKGVGRVDGSEVLRSGAGSRGGSRFGAGVPEARGPDLSRVDRGDGRDPRGRFTGKGNYGKDKEKLGLDKVERDGGFPLVRKQVRVHVQGLEHGRCYDGLLEVGDDAFIGVEVKSGTASLTGRQREFDQRVSPSSPAFGMLGGQKIRIIGVLLERVE